MLYPVILFWIFGINMVSAGVRPEVHQQCIDAKDYSGCVRSNQGQASSRNQLLNASNQIKRRYQKALASAVYSDQTSFRDDCMSRLDDAHFERGEGFPQADG